MPAGALDEVELKLELSAQAADAFEAADLFPVDSTVIQQHAIYFDTPDHRLDKAGLFLRIRRVGRKRVQTIKADVGDAAGLFTRQEWEREVKNDQPVLDDTTPIKALLGDRIAELVPLFVIQNERRLWQLDGIEIALDRGRIIAGERETFVCEVELEQKSGDFAGLFSLSRQIAAVAPMRLSVLNKAQRGYRLLGPLPEAAKAKAVALSPDMTSADAFQVIANACMVHFRLNELLVLENDDPAALHQARVALRRLRSAFSIHKPMLAGSDSTALTDGLRWLAGELAEARDLDVLVDRMCQGSLRERLSEARADAFTKAIGALQSVRAKMLMLDLAEWLAIGDWRVRPEMQHIRDLPARKAASKALERYRRKIRKGGRDLESLDDAARHEIRKSAKKLRYAADFFAALFVRKRERRRHERFVRVLEKLQDQLGSLNDLATVHSVLARLDLADHPQAAALLGAKKKPRLLAAAAASYGDLIDTKRFWR